MQKNIKLIIGLSLPILVIIFIIGSVVVQKMIFKPQYDFLYTVDSYCVNSDCRFYYNYNTWNAYKIVDGKIAKETIFPKVDSYYERSYPDQPINKFEPQYPKIYRYSVKNDSFSEISFDEVQKITLTDSGSAPDGTVVVTDSGNRGGGGLITEVFVGGGYSYRYGLYMKNGSSSKKIIVQNGAQDNYYGGNNNFHLIGWVK